MILKNILVLMLNILMIRMAKLNIKIKDNTLLGVKYKQKCEDNGCSTCG